MTSHLLCQSIALNLKPVPAGTMPDEAMAMARVAFQASTVLRFALSEFVALVALVLSFAVHPTSWMTYVIGKARQRLDRDGGQSFLRDALLVWLPARPRRGSSAADIQPTQSPIPSKHKRMSR